MTMNNRVKAISRFISANSPVILTGLGVAGLVGTTLLGIRAGMKTGRRWADEETWYAMQGENDKQISAKRKFELAWKEYIPVVVSGAASIVCIIGSHSVSSRRQAAVAGLYAISETALAEYKEKLVESIGKNKAEKVHDDIIQDRVTRTTEESKLVVVGTEEVLCYEVLTGRYFSSDQESIRKAMNDLNFQIQREMSASLNEFNYKIGLPAVALGEEVGWNTDKPLEIIFTSVLSENGKPCLAIDYRDQPFRNFYRVF